MADSTSHNSKSLPGKKPAGDAVPPVQTPVGDTAPPFKPAPEYFQIDLSPEGELPKLGAGSAAKSPHPMDATSPPTQQPFDGKVDKQPTVISRQEPLSMSATPYGGIAASAIEIAALLEGATLGYFKLGPFIGGGGMGAVFRAIDTMLDRTVAVKVLSRDKTDEEVLRRFKNEAQSAARLDHDNIARVFYVGEDKGWNYIVFEYIEGLNIRDLVLEQEQERLPLAEAINYTIQVADALEHAYRRDVVHRDIKPSNIIVTSDGHAKLVDMGLARLHQVSSPATDLTASGVTLGTFDYISPEQAHDPRSADVRSDLYSLGCTLYFMLTGRPPFPDGTVLQKLLNHSREAPPDPRQFRPKLPEEIVAIVSRLLAKSADDRFQTPGELTAELLLASERLGITGLARGSMWISRAPRPVKAWRRHLPWMATLTALVAAVFGLDWFWPVTTTDVPGFSTVIVDSPPFLAAAKPIETPTIGQADLDRMPPAPMPDLNPAALAPREVSLPPVASERPGATLSDPKTPPPPSEISVPATTDPVKPPMADPSSVVSSPPAEAESTMDETVTPRLIVVAAEPLLDAPGDELWAATLADACKEAADYPDLEAIELRFSGQRLSNPFEVTSDRLVIRAGADFSPVVVFAPQEDDPAPEDGFIRVSGGELQVERVHFRVMLPTAPYHIPWSLFQLDKVTRIGLHRCTATIQNLDDRGHEPQYNVSFFNVQGPQMFEAMMMPNSPVPTADVPPLIDLSECTLRGQATLARAEQATPFRLSWTQGLFVSSHRLIETSGAASRQPSEGYVWVEMQHVTVIAMDGACLINRSPDAPYQLGLNFDARRCIFLTAESSPLVEHQGVENLEMTKLTISGEYNFYPQTRMVWRVNETNQPTREFTFDDANRDTTWFRLTWPGHAVIWKTAPDNELAAHARTPADYLLRDTSSNPAFTPGGKQAAGFDISLVESPPLFHPLPGNRGA